MGAKTFIASSQTIVSGVKVFVKRHYELTPTIGESASRVTLYFTKQEFDAYNTAYGNTNHASLPENLKVVQYHGTSTSGNPGTYSGDTEIITDLTVTLNEKHTIYAVSFDIAGFSGVLHFRRVESLFTSYIVCF